MGEEAGSLWTRARTSFYSEGNGATWRVLSRGITRPHTQKHHSGSVRIFFRETKVEIVKTGGGGDNSEKELDSRVCWWVLHRLRE